ncbi:glycoside hydrolase superfamily [Delphinella strobiligena]|nr:glycoside hydrolase superfamily [Delphinella strobiligena]
MAASSVLPGSINSIPGSEREGDNYRLAAREVATTSSTVSSVSAAATSTGFNPFATNNLGVYYGYSQKTGYPLLYPLCQDSNVNIVAMGFLRKFNGPNTVPTFGFGKACSQSATTCPDLAANITACQSNGKKVLISLGGSSSNITFNTSSEAVEAAHILWNTFGAGTDGNITRPFGNVTVDGFDFDVEGLPVTHLEVLASTLQELFATSSPTRYTTTAPLCANNTVFSPGYYENMNFVWPRFYNAKSCNMGSKGFNSSVLRWYNYLEGVISNISSSYPLFYIGALSFDNSNSGYVGPDEFAREILAIRPKVSSIFGGATLWEGSDALVTVDGSGNNYLTVAKKALNNVSSAGAKFECYAWFWLSLVVGGVTLL